MKVRNVISRTKNVQSSFNNNLYIPLDGVVTGSSFGPVVDNIFLVELKSILVPKLDDHVKNRRSFVYETFAYAKHGSSEYVLSVLNSFMIT